MVLVIRIGWVFQRLRSILQVEKLTYMRSMGLGLEADPDPDSRVMHR